MTARDLMTTSLAVVPPKTPVVGLANLLASRGISAVPVTSAEGRLLGLVTEGDLICRLVEGKGGSLGWFLALLEDRRKLADRFAKAHGASAQDVMSRDLITVDEEAGTNDFPRLMETNQIRRVPVVRDGKLAGIVSRADLLRAVLAAAVPAATDDTLDSALLRTVPTAMREQPLVDTFYVFPRVNSGVVSIHGFYRSEEGQRGLKVLAQAVPGIKSAKDRTGPMPFFLRASL